MYLSDKQRGKCLEADVANYEIKRENSAKLKIKLIGLCNYCLKFCQMMLQKSNFKTVLMIKALVLW